MLSVILALSLFLIQMDTAPTQLSVEITNLAKSGGTLRVALYKPGGNFGKTTPAFYKNIAIDQPGSRRVVFEVPAGTYAIAVYQDLNDNGKLDRNLIGYPKEPFGFSNNFRPVVAAPDFDDCAFEVTGATATVSIKLID